MTAPVLEVSGLVKHFRASGGRTVHAVNGVSFAVRPGETLGIVGESGSGKSTLGRAVVRLLEPTAGSVRFQDRDITRLSMAQCRPLRAEMQMVFQDPWSALNPRIRIGELIGEPLKLHRPMPAGERRDRVEELARKVRLPSELLARFPSELSGGQLQRVCIARAIATRPKLIVLDEPTSSLDLSVRAGILDLLAELKAETAAAMIFISHDLGTLKLISDRVMVLYLGTAVETAAAGPLFERPVHPYTQALLSAHLPANPDAVLRRHMLEGEIPSPIDLPRGCGFASRCPVAVGECHASQPSLAAVGQGDRQAACRRIAEGANWLTTA